jgi:hypothetical protein
MSVMYGGVTSCDSYMCVPYREKQASYAAPFGECRILRIAPHIIQKAAGDLKLMEMVMAKGKDTISCGPGEALRSFMTTTVIGYKNQMGWKYTCCKFAADSGPAVYRKGQCFPTSAEKTKNTESWKGTYWAGPCLYVLM